MRINATVNDQKLQMASLQNKSSSLGNQ